MRLEDAKDWASVERYLIDTTLATVYASEQAYSKIAKIERQLHAELDREVEAGRNTLGSDPENMYASYFKASVAWQDAGGEIASLERRATMYAAAATAVRGYRSKMAVEGLGSSLI